MQNIIRQLKRLQSIAPDPDYTRRSRSLLVAAPVTQKPLSPWRVLVTSFQFGSAVALTAALLVIVLAGFSAWKILPPFRLGSLDPASLRAEAEAVDIQIKLTNLAYPEENRNAGAKAAPKAIAPAPASGAEATSTEEKVGVDEALDILTK
jgi:hypothetical protein